MVTLPSLPDTVPNVRAPTSGVSPAQIAQPYQEMAQNLNQASGELNDTAVALAKQAGMKAVTRDADGNIQVDRPPLVGDAAIAFQQAVKFAAVADGEGKLKRDDIAMRQQFRDNPAGYEAAADAYKKKAVDDYTAAAGPEVGMTIGKIVDGQTTLTYRGLLNEHERLEMDRADSSIKTGIQSATDDLTAMARGGVTSGTAWDAAKDKINTLTQQRLNNPRLAYTPEQAAFDQQHLQGELAANAYLNHIDQIYKSDDPEKGGSRGALEEAKGILTDPSIKLSENQREQYYHKAVSEIRANEAVRHQDIGEARQSFSELRSAAALGQRIAPDDVEAVAGAFKAAGYPAGAAQVYATFAHKDLHDNFGQQPLAGQTQELNTIKGAQAARDAFRFFTAKGYRPEEAAGIVGNLVHESDMNPTAMGDKGTSGGVAQFHNERLTALKAYAASVGKPAGDLQTQLEFIDKELHGPEAATLAKLQTAKSPEEAAAAFINYERPYGWTPQNPAGGLGFQNRVAMARSVFGGAAAPGSTGPGTASWLIANRQATLDDSTTKAWKAAMDDWSSGKGGGPSVAQSTDLLNAARASGNVDLLAKMQRDMDVIDKVQRIAALPVDQQVATETELKRQMAAGTAFPGAELVEKQLLARTQAIQKGLDDDPVATAVTNFPDKFKTPAPLNMADPGQLAAGLKMRAGIVQAAAANWGTPPLSALDSQELTQVKAVIAGPDPQAKIQMLGALSTLPEDVRNATLAKIGRGNPDLMVSVAAGSMMKEAPEMAGSIIRGQAAIAADKGYLPGKGAEAANFDEGISKALPASVFSLAARTDPTGPYGVAQGLIKARYADLSAQQADTTGKLNPDRLQRAVDDVTGGVLTHNGGQLIAPVRGMKQADFDRVISGITDSDLGNGPIPNNFAEANTALKMTPQEQALYQRHLSNLTGSGGVTNSDGSRSSLYQSVQEHDGKFYNIPTVWNGKIETEKWTDANGKVWDVPNKTALANVEKEGWDKFPSYATSEEADARYDKMHDFMEKDTEQWQKGRTSAVTTPDGHPITAADLQGRYTLESQLGGQYLIRVGKEPPVYAYQGANSEAPQKFMLDLRNRPLGPAPVNQPTVMP